MIEVPGTPPLHGNIEEELRLLTELMNDDEIYMIRSIDFMPTVKYVDEYSARVFNSACVDMKFEVEGKDNLSFYLSLERSAEYCGSMAYCVKDGRRVELFQSRESLWAHCYERIEVDPKVMRHLTFMITAVNQHLLERAAFELAWPSLPNLWPEPK